MILATAIIVSLAAVILAERVIDRLWRAWRQRRNRRKAGTRTRQREWDGYDGGYWD